MEGEDEIRKKFTNFEIFSSHLKDSSLNEKHRFGLENEDFNFELIKTFNSILNFQLILPFQIQMQ